MSRIWTSRKDCLYVPDFVYVTAQFTNPIPEPDMDKLIADFLEIASDYATNKHYRVDADDMSYDETDAIEANGIIVQCLTGNIVAMARCEHGDGPDFVDKIDYEAGKAGGRVIDVNFVMDDSSI